MDKLLRGLSIFLLLIATLTTYTTHATAYGQNYKPEDWKQNINYVFYGTLKDIEQGELLSDGKYHQHRKMRLVVNVEEELLNKKWNQETVRIDYNSQIPKENETDSREILIADNIYFGQDAIGQSYIFTVTSFELIRMGEDESREQKFFLNNSYLVTDNRIRIVDQYAQETNTPIYKNISLNDLKNRIARGKKSVQEDASAPTFKKIVKVIDPITVELKNTTRIRLIGLNVPEEKSEEAVAFLNEVALNREIRLEYDQEIIDENNRGYLLAYVHLFDCSGCKINRRYELYETRFGQEVYTFLNASLIKAGYAEPIQQTVNNKHKQTFDKLHQEAVMKLSGKLN